MRQNLMDVLFDGEAISEHDKNLKTYFDAAVEKLDVDSRKMPSRRAINQDAWL